MPGLGPAQTDVDEAIDVKPFGEELGEFLLDESADLDWLLPLEDEKPVLSELHRVVDGLPAADEASEHGGYKPEEMEQLDMRSLLGRETYTAFPPATAPVAWSAEWLAEWAAVMTSSDTVPLALGPSAANHLHCFDLYCIN